jgi:hypothetical protein
MGAWRPGRSPWALSLLCTVEPCSRLGAACTARLRAPRRARTGLTRVQTGRVAVYAWGATNTAIMSRITRPVQAPWSCLRDTPHQPQVPRAGFEPALLRSERSVLPVRLPRSVSSLLSITYEQPDSFLTTGSLYFDSLHPDSASGLCIRTLHPSSSTALSCSSLLQLSPAALCIRSLLQLSAAAPGWAWRDSNPQLTD